MRVVSGEQTDISRVCRRLNNPTYLSIPGFNRYGRGG